MPVTHSMATYPAEPLTAVPALNISPWLVASRSPWNRLAIERRPKLPPSLATSLGSGSSLTSNAPLARSFVKVACSFSSDRVQVASDPVQLVAELRLVGGLLPHDGVRQLE